MGKSVCFCFGLMESIWSYKSMIGQRGLWYSGSKLGKLIKPPYSYSSWGLCVLGSFLLIIRRASASGEYWRMFWWPTSWEKGKRRSQSNLLSSTVFFMLNTQYTKMPSFGVVWSEPYQSFYMICVIKEHKRRNHVFWLPQLEMQWNL